MIVIFNHYVHKEGTMYTMFLRVLCAFIVFFLVIFYCNIKKKPPTPVIIDWLRLLSNYQFFIPSTELLSKKANAVSKVLNLIKIKIRSLTHS